ncbi:DUF2066 domain-containing protein [Candidatus Albibeggiatoa sp. nov. NOAA]|uniref:DUF2066 domain-containing protein n=1 Tax=Candidatus Albibeggiatoa sp. nov. NOAA TaxID=3162724 RepID=UPI0033005FD1|nr:DUF2066 domain-containing protein [Thiotrichaceae bacterium]
MKNIVIGLLLLIAYPAWSIDLYQAQVVVADTTEEYRLPALKQVLQHVLVKLTGIHNINLSADDISDVEQWVQQFSYKSETGQVWLEASFSHQPINTLLEKLNLDIWRLPRPAVLGWIVHHNEIINNTQQVNRMQVLKAQAEDQGIEMVFPILDLSEKRAFPLKQVEQYNEADIQQLAKRYGVEAVLVGYIAEENQQKAQWQLFYHNKRLTWDTEHKQLNELLMSGIEQAIDKLAPKSVQQANTAGKQSNKPAPQIETKQPTVSTRLTLTIRNVPNLTVYAKINRYLKNLAEVQEIEMKNMSSNQLLFEMTVKATQEQFAKVLQDSQIIYIQSQTENNIVGRFQDNI